MTKKYVGAYKRGRYWYARITFKTVTHHLGRFPNEKKAGEAYLNAKKILEDQFKKSKNNIIELTPKQNDKLIEQLVFL